MSGYNKMLCKTDATYIRKRQGNFKQKIVIIVRLNIKK